MAVPNNIISFDGSIPRIQGFSLHERYRSTINACRQVLSRYLPVLMSGMFENLDDALYELADKADSNQVQTSYFDAMREVRKHRERIENSFQGRTLDGFDQFWKTGSWGFSGQTSSGMDGEGLSLMDQNELEEGLAVSTMTSRGENRYFRELYNMDRSFSYMAGGFKMNTKNNPLAPAAICAAFEGATGELTLDLQFKLVIYKQFERKVIDTLGGLYKELNSLLIESDILPTISARIHQRTYHGKPAGFGATRGDADGRVYPEEREELQTELFSSLQSLLSQYRPMPTPAGVVDDPQLPVARSSDMLAVLSNMQNKHHMAQLSNEPGKAVDFDIRASLLQILQSGTGGEGKKRVEKSDQDAIDVITMLFEFILEDQNLPDAMRALLARLQIPMLKVAIIDKDFFSKKLHPARRLLNSLAQAAVGWSEGNGRVEGGLYARMESIVQQITNRFDDDIGLFSELYEEFSDFLRQEEQGSKIAEQRTTQITRGREQLKSARHRVFEEINNRLLARGQVSEVVVTLLKDGWKNVLLLICLRKGLDSPEWITALETMDRLLWSVEPKQEQEQRQELLKEMPRLLKSLRIGLNDISYDQHKMACLFKDLQSCHLNCMKGNTLVSQVSDETLALWKEQVQGGEPEPARSDSVVEEFAEREIGSPDSIENETAGEEIHDDHSRAAETLAIGTWIEIRQDEGTQVRAKLSWRSRMSKTCLFVNRKGMKVADVSLRELAGWFRNGKAEILDQTGVPLVDRALVSMMKALKSGEATQAKPEA